jgi:predicted 3-demethylubiquinone-9 3-methyltransferase (glyoxalase superfamily)
MAKFQKITPCLWFDHEAEQAAEFYCAIFPNSRIVQVSRYGEAGHEHHGKPAGSVMMVAFELDGQGFTALNGGPVFRFTEAVSFQVGCSDQAELDHYWDSLSAGGDPTAQQCGWLKDRYGLSWQIIPDVLGELMSRTVPARSDRVMNAMLQMKKIDIAALRRAAEAA